jgi:molybdate transport system ATP-binding protein
MGFDLTLTHRFSAFELDISLKGDSGVTVLFGPSGAGKTSVIRAMAGLLTPDQGRITLAGQDVFCSKRQINIPVHKRGVGYVFQDARLFPHKSVAQNLRFNCTAPIDRDLIERLGIAHLLGRRTHGLSGGEAQRVAFARALMHARHMLLLDEPLAALDTPRKAAILPYLDQLKSKSALPMLYVTHSVEELARLADQVVILDQGRIVQAGSVFEILSEPKCIPYLGVHEAGSVLAGTIVHHRGGLSQLSTVIGPLQVPQLSASPGESVRIRLLARDIILAKQRPADISARNILPVTIEHLSPGRGPGVAVALRARGTKLLARITQQSRLELGLEPGQDIFAILKATSVSRSAVSY